MGEKSYKVFVINLARAKDRLTVISERLRELGIPFERIEAADAETLTESEISKYYSLKLNKHRMTRFMTKGEVACYISHIYCWQRIISERLDFAITIEDDALPTRELNDAIEFLSRYNGDFGYLQLGWRSANKEKCRVKYSDGKFEIVEYRRFSGETPIDAVSYNAAKTLLKNCIPFGRPVDSDSNFYWDTKIRRCGLRPYSYVYEESKFETSIIGRDSNRKRTGSIFATSTVQDIYYYLFDKWHSLNCIASKLGITNLPFRLLRICSSLIPNRRMRKEIRLYCKKKIGREFDIQESLAEYLRENYVRPYLRGELPKYDVSAKDRNITPNKTLWQFWFQGINNINSEVVRLCFASVDRSGLKLEHKILDKDTISQYIDIPSNIYKKLLDCDTQKKIALFSDILRLYLLYAYGGVWADATCFFTSRIPQKILDADFFMFQRVPDAANQREFELLNSDYFSWDSRNRVKSLNSFIVAKKGHKIIGALKDILTEYWRREDNTPHYFIFQILFDILQEYPQFRAVNCDTVDDTKPHILAKNLNKKYTEELWSEISNISFIHKLNYGTMASDTRKVPHFLKNFAYSTDVFSPVNKVRTLSRCPICNSVTFSVTNEYDVDNLVGIWQSKYKINPIPPEYRSKTLHRMHCNTCGCFFYDLNIPDSGEMYAALAKSPGYYSEWKWEYDAAVKLINKIKPKSLLEIGAGFGYFLRMLHSLVPKLSCTEFNPDAISILNKMGIKVYPKSIDKLEEKFDFICSFQVFEHISDIRNVLRDVSRLLSKNARLIISVPNPCGILKVTGGILELPPHHRTDFTLNSFEYIAKEFNLSIEHYYTMPLSKEEIRWLKSKNIKSVEAGHSHLVCFKSSN